MKVWCVLLLAAAAVANAAAQRYLTKPVRFIVPFPPGGGADVIGRVLGAKLATELAASAPADGHTLYQYNIANAIAVGLYKKLNYDPVKDFSAVTLLASSPFILVVHPSVKASAPSTITRAPFYALGPVKNYINYTDGGLAVNTGLQVLGKNDVPIQRLYAAGATGQGGLLLKGHGNHLGWGFTSGRLAGEYAAQRTPRSAKE